MIQRAWLYKVWQEDTKPARSGASLAERLGSLAFTYLWRQLGN